MAAITNNAFSFSEASSGNVRPSIAIYIILNIYQYIDLLSNNIHYSIHKINALFFHKPPMQVIINLHYPDFSNRVHCMLWYYIYQMARKQIFLVVLEMPLKV